MMPDECPVDPDAMREAYRAGKLPPEEAIAFEDHFIGCYGCGVRLEVDEFTVAFRRASERYAVPDSDREKV